MSRVLSRPMFRRGGSAGSGITSGLSRPGYHRGRVVRPGGYQGINEVEEQLAMIDKLAPYRGTDISDFLIGFGLNMAGGPPSGNIISTAAKAAQGPYKQFIEGSRGEDAARRATATSLLTGQLNREAEERKTGVKMQMISLLDKDYGPKIEKIKTDIKVLEQKHGKKGEDGAITFEDVNIQKAYDGLKSQLDQTQSEWDVQRNRIIVPGKSKAAQILEVYTSLVKAATETAVPGGQAIDYEALMQEAKNQVEAAYRAGNATGGRVGYQQGLSVDKLSELNKATVTPFKEPPKTMSEEVDVTEEIEEEPKQKPSIDMSYDEFRSKMDAQVSDEVVRLIYYNPTAFADFANIETQEDVYEFNNKYNVNLVLPFTTQST